MSGKKSINRVLGFDFGVLRIGIAIGQRLTGNASPLCIIKSNNGAPDWDQIKSLIDEWQPDALVVGRPLTMDGEEQEITARAVKFGKRLHGRFGLPVIYVDERLSSYEAENRLADLPSGSAKRKMGIDDAAAALIVETWLADYPEN